MKQQQGSTLPLPMKRLLLRASSTLHRGGQAGAPGQGGTRRTGTRWKCWSHPRRVPEHPPHSLQESKKTTGERVTKGTAMHGSGATIREHRFAQALLSQLVQTASKRLPLPALLKSQGLFQPRSEPRRTHQRSWPGYHKREASRAPSGTREERASTGAVSETAPGSLLVGKQ